MLLEINSVIFYFGLLEWVAIVGWLGQWGKYRALGRYAMLTFLVGSILFLFISGAFFKLAADGRFAPIVMIPSGYGKIALMMLCMGAAGIPCLIRPLRRLLRKTCFPGLDDANPAHTWALFIYLSTLVLCVFSITILYNTQSIIESLSEIPIFLVALMNMAAFILFALIASGLGVKQTFPDILQKLGVTALPWKTVLKLVSFSFLLSLSMQFIEFFLMKLVDPQTQHALQSISDAMKVTGSVGYTLGIACIVGLSAGVGEEILFRGLLQPVFGLFPTAVLFAMIHTHYGPTVLLIELLFVGLILGYIRRRWNTTAAMIVHGCFDFLAIVTSLIHH